jgi:hypothetical protein
MINLEKSPFVWTLSPSYHNTLADLGTMFVTSGSVINSDLTLVASWLSTMHDRFCNVSSSGISMITLPHEDFGLAVSSLPELWWNCGLFLQQKRLQSLRSKKYFV